MPRTIPLTGSVMLPLQDNLWSGHNFYLHLLLCDLQGYVPTPSGQREGQQAVY